MKNQSGKSPLVWIITITVVLIIVGVSIAMIFGGTDIVSEIKGKIQNSNTNNTVQSQTK